MVEAGRHLAGDNAEFGIDQADASATIVDRCRHGVLAHRHARAGGVDQADGLVGQLARRDIARGQPHRLADRFVDDSHLVVLLEGGDQATDHRRRHLLGGLLDLHRLEAAGEGGILLEVFLVLGPGGRRDGAQLAARQGRLQQIRRIVLASLAAGANQRVGFVDEQDDRLGARLGLFDHRFQAVLELALYARAGLQQAEIERPQGDVTQRRRHVARGDAQRQALDHRRLADTGFAGEDRVVLPAAGQDIDHLPDLDIAAENGIDLAALGLGGEVDGELIERGRPAGPSFAGTGRRRFGAVGLGRRLGRFGGVLAKGEQLALQDVGRDGAQPRRDFPRPQGQGLVGQQRPQKMAGAHPARAVFDRCEQPGVLHHVHDVGRQRGRAGVAGLHAVQRPADIGQQPRRIDFPAPQDGGDVSVGPVEQADQHVLDFDVVMRPQRCRAGGGFERAAADIVETSNERLQLDRAHVILASSWDISRQACKAPATGWIFCKVGRRHKRRLEDRTAVSVGPSIATCTIRQVPSAWRGRRAIDGRCHSKTHAFLTLCRHNA